MLLDLWESSRDQLTGKSVQQVIAFAGDGRLKEGNETSAEFRRYLAAIPSEMLKRYAEECLESKFEDSGFALQDIVNEIGSRLGFSVTPGRYRGTAKQPGHDGLWRTEDAALVVEIKTTTAYTVDLNVVAGYRRQLVEAGEVDAENTTILIVVGRFDTDGWEAQTRGSRHAWLLRLVSVDSLLRLLDVKERLDDPVVLYKTREILKPHEYTRVDGIVDLVFSTAEDLTELEDDDASDDESDPDVEPKDRAKPVAFHADCIARVEKALGVTLVKESRSTWVTPDDAIAVQCSVSKRHGEGAFWFAFHPHQKERLERYDTAYLALGCGSASRTLLIPLKEVMSWLDKTWTTKLKDREYWHIKIRDAPEGLALLTKSGVASVPLQEYALKSAGEAEAAPK